MLTRIPPEAWRLQNWAWSMGCISLSAGYILTSSIYKTHCRDLHGIGAALGIPTSSIGIGLPIPNPLCLAIKPAESIPCSRIHSMGSILNDGSTTSRSLKRRHKVAGFSITPATLCDHLVCHTFHHTIPCDWSATFNDDSATSRRRPERFRNPLL